jgi:hypothetical protein
MRVNTVTGDVEALFRLQGEGLSRELEDLDAQFR